MAVVGHDGTLVGGEVIALVDADQELILAQPYIIPVFEQVIVIFAQRDLGAVDVGTVGAGVDQHVRARAEVDAGVFARQVALRVG